LSKAEISLNKPSGKWMLQSIHRFIAMGFGSGLAPLAPGTVGTLWAWVGFLVGQYFLSDADCLWVIMCGFGLGCWICGQVSHELRLPDFGGIVWDEIIAFWIVLFMISPANIYLQATAFILFRFFDIAKPEPIRSVDRYFKNQNQDDATMLRILWRGFGIMIDDVIAAFFTLLVIAIAMQIY
jgi:phosphatidylglycerophosphatase A